MDLLYPYQLDAVSRMKNGCILNGGVGSGKSRTALYYYREREASRPLYIITTARKRDTREWEKEFEAFDGMKAEAIDSWNNIAKYKEVRGAFFIFDEQRVIGSGAWVKAFLAIARENRWVLLSATPGDTWSDYIPVFIANGFYRNKTEFIRDHVIYNRFMKFPKVDYYVGTKKLERLRDQILVTMDFKRETVAHHEDIWVSYDAEKYKEVGKYRWDPFKSEPIRDAAALCYVWRKITNSDISRSRALLALLEAHLKVIIFYNFDYELEILRDTLGRIDDFQIAEWNGHKHEPIPTGDAWAYLVQYTAGCEGWNCVETDTIIFYSQNYSYKVMEQASGRIDRLNTPFSDLYYYHLKSRSGIDLAIAKALYQKKNFNERRFVGDGS